MIKLLHITIRGDSYKIDKHGCVFGGPNNVSPGCKDGHEWRFIGVSTHYLTNHVTIPFKDIWNDPQLAIKGYMWDLDHGTQREWMGMYNGGIPRITSAYIGYHKTLNGN